MIDQGRRRSSGTAIIGYIIGYAQSAAVQPSSPCVIQCDAHTQQQQQHEGKAPATAKGVVSKRRVDSSSSVGPVPPDGLLRCVALGCRYTYRITRTCLLTTPTTKYAQSRPSSGAARQHRGTSIVKQEPPRQPPPPLPAPSPRLPPRGTSARPLIPPQRDTATET